MPKPTDHERNLAIIDMHASGMTLEQVGDKYSLSRERVRQILEKNGITRYDGGKSKQTENKGLKIEIARDQRYFDLHGCDYETYRKLKRVLDGDGRNPQHRYREHKRNSKVKKIPWHFNFYDWWLVWEDSGKWPERGRAKNQYGMARIDSALPYSPDNVHIVTHEESSRLARMQSLLDKGYYN